MKKLAVIIILIIVITAVIAAFKLSSDKIGQRNIMDTESKKISSLTLTSPAFERNKSIPSKYTCDGININPPLKISGVSEKTKSLVLIMDDPDAPVGIWDHWIKWNIPASATLIFEGQEPEGVSGKGTSGNLTYVGPCPPSGEHRYFFKLYTLDTKLDLPEGSNKKETGNAMQGHILQQTELVGLYKRN